MGKKIKLEIRIARTDELRRKAAASQRLTTKKRAEQLTVNLIRLIIQSKLGLLEPTGPGRAIRVYEVLQKTSGLGKDVRSVEQKRLLTMLLGGSGADTFLKEWKKVTEENQ